MAYSLRIAQLALDDIDGIVARLFREASPRVAAEWLDGVEIAAQALTEMPRSLPLAPENEDADFEVRQSHHESHRVLFTVEEGTVVVLRVYHGALGFCELSIAYRATNGLPSYLPCVMRKTAPVFLEILTKAVPPW